MSCCANNDELNLPVSRLHSDWHDIGTSRKCVHALSDPPAVFVVDKTAVSRLNMQARVITNGAPCIASRRGSTLTISFDALGPVDKPHPDKGGSKTKDHRVAHQWKYSLIPVTERDDIMLATRQQ